MAGAINRLVWRHTIDARSEAADAALNWRDPKESDRLTRADLQREGEDERRIREAAEGALQAAVGSLEKYDTAYTKLQREVGRLKEDYSILREALKQSDANRLKLIAGNERLREAGRDVIKAWEHPDATAFMWAMGVLRAILTNGEKNDRNTKTSSSS